MNKKVSIITPILNEESHILEFISSIKSQTYRPIELILVDGGSTDKTLFNISSFCLNEELFSIKLYNEFGVCKSPANARNIGLDNSSGDLILMIDCDTNFVSKNILHKTIEEMNDDCSILIEFFPIIDTEIEQFISDTSKRSGVILYKKTLIGENRYDSSLGYGEDRVFTYTIFQNLDYNGKVASIKIGRHYPHTIKEYTKQNIWYGRTILKYIIKSFKTNRNDFYIRLVFVFYNISVCLFPPMCIFKNYKYKPKRMFGYVNLFTYSFIESIYFVKGLVRGLT